MKIEEIKPFIRKKKKVTCGGCNYTVGNECKIIFDQFQQNFYYSIMLVDETSPRSVLWARLEDVEAREDDKETV